MKPITRGRLAQMTAMKAETIRFYEKCGVLPPPPRSEAGHRQYPAATVDQLLLIRQLRQSGFTLDEVRRLLQLRSAPTAAAAEVELRLAELRQSVQRLRQVLPP